jgi:hypothetical protein
MVEREELRPRRLSAAAALVVGLPLLFFLASILYPRHEAAEPPGEPEPSVEAATVDGWVGAVEAPGGGRLLVRLARLHASELRQAFDRDALARRFELGAGEPWRLVLRLVAEEGTGELALARLAVEDSKGDVLAPIRAALSLAPNAIGDPLATLLAPPERLRPGEERSLVLWGGEPAPGGVRLTGLEALGERGEALAIALERRALTREPDEMALASLERPVASDALAQEADAEGSAREE